MEQPETRSIRSAIKELNGQIVSVELPADEVDYVGREQILAMVRDMGYQLPADWSWDWNLSTGYIKGNLPVRVRNYVWKNFQHNMSDEMVSKIGNVGRAHSLSDAVYHVDFDNAIKWRNGAFGDYVSCFFMSRDYVLPLLRKRAFAMRFWAEGYDNAYELSISGYSSRSETNNPRKAYTEHFKMYNAVKDGKLGWGRVWVAPDTPEEGEAILFNSYPPGLQVLTCARVFAKVFGYEVYKRIDLVNFGEAYDFLYINGGVGYLVSPNKERLTDIYSYDLEWEGKLR